MEGGEAVAALSGNSHRLTMMSLFSGSGGFELVAEMNGITPIANAEVEPFPIMVTHKRMPSVKHYGDVSTINGAEVEPVDIITFGSPCFPAGTLVLTGKGYSNIEDVSVGTMVLTHTGRWRRVTAIGHKTGETVILRGNHYGLECTPNHPIYSADIKMAYPRYGDGSRGCKRNISDKKTWTSAVDMHEKLWSVPLKTDYIPIAEPHYSGDPAEKRMPEMNVDFFYFVGRWLGDGWVRNSQRPDRPNGQRHGVIYICDSSDFISLM